MAQPKVLEELGQRAELDGSGKLQTSQFPASYSKDIANGVAGLDGAGKLQTSQFPSTYSKNVANGVAGLDASGKVLAAQLPATSSGATMTLSDVRAIALYSL